MQEMNTKMNSAQEKFRKFLSRFAGSSAWRVLSLAGDFLAGKNIEAYLVGGLVRDMPLERATADIDLAVAANALEVAPEAAAVLGGRYFPLDKENGIGRVIISDQQATPGKGQWELDFSTLQGSLEQDLARRDFTVDAMAINLRQLFEAPQEAQLIDPFHGLDDLYEQRIRAVSERAFESDPVRLLRAVRLAAELEFSIEKETEALIRRDSRLVARVAGERIREELLRLLALPGAGQQLFYLDGLCLMTAIFPELAEMKGVEQPKEHFWDIFNHSLNSIVALEFLLRQGNWEHAGIEVLDSVPWSEDLAKHFDQEVSSGSTRRSLLKLAALLHDISKPQTKGIYRGRVRFLGHAQEGAARAVEAMERLRFSSKEIKLVETEVQYHLRPGQMSQEGLPSRRAIYRYFRDAGETGIDILFLSLADHLAARGPTLIPSHWREHAELVEYVLSRHFEEITLASPPRLIDGHDLINLFGMKPGPRIGEVLEAVREAQAEGEISSKEQALSLVKRLTDKSSDEAA
jgi:poly(A) polymerase